AGRRRRPVSAAVPGQQRSDRRGAGPVCRRLDADLPVALRPGTLAATLCRTDAVGTGRKRPQDPGRGLSRFRHRLPGNTGRGGDGLHRYAGRARRADALHLLSQRCPGPRQRTGCAGSGTAGMTPRAIELDVDGVTVAALRSGAAGGLKVLALHGWLDNAASFLPLATQLPALDLVMVDLPGHGFSSHLPPTTPYTTPHAVVQTLAIIDALGWERCVLLGHSSGAAMAGPVAAVAPDRVTALVSIEALGGVSAPAGETLQRLRAHVDAVRKLEGKQLRVFPDLAVPVRARMMVNQLSEDSARLLIERGVKQVDGGWSWRSD